MKNEKEKKGLLRRLIGGKKNEKNTCCSFQVIEMPENDFEDKDQKKDNPKEKK